VWRNSQNKYHHQQRTFTDSENKKIIHSAKSLKLLKEALDELPRKPPPICLFIEILYNPSNNSQHIQRLNITFQIENFQKKNSSIWLSFLIR